ncbi:MAG: lysylphosphatidylglycerol synthase transmembrane domain-containing protein [Bacteroidota bacterium]|nr:lysylphosphatidylglycerol synthase transmembrane domain-containing protein [Bacteroidota bacterium]
MKAFFLHPVVSFLMKLIISASLLIGLIFYIDFHSLIASLSNANKVYLTIGFLLVGANIGMHFLRWRYVLHLISSDISPGEVFTSLLVGLTTGFFTPGQIGEFAGRIASHPNIRKSYVVGLSVIDKLYLLALTLVSGICALSLFFYLHLSEYWKVGYGVIGFLIIVLVLFIFLFPEITKKLLLFVPEKIRQHRLYNIIEVIETKFHNREGQTLFLLTALLYTIIFFQYFIFSIAFEPVSIGNSLMCSASVYFVKAVVLPISIGDLGVRESAAVFFFSKVGVSAASAFNASMCMFIANLVIPSVAGAILIMKVKLK